MRIYYSQDGWSCGELSNTLHLRYDDTEDEYIIHNYRSKPATVVVSSDYHGKFPLLLFEELDGPIRVRVRQTYTNDFIGISDWDVTGVTDMSEMFKDCENFDQPLNNWDVSNVTDMSEMFSGCTSFDQPLNNWDVSSVTNMREMFCGCTSFDQPLNNWDVSNVTDMSGMFGRSLNNWGVLDVADMSDMFYNCNLFQTNS